MGDKEVEEFLTYLAVQGKVATKTQSLALNSLSFLYKEILKTPFLLRSAFNARN